MMLFKLRTHVKKLMLLALLLLGTQAHCCFAAFATQHETVPAYYKTAHTQIHKTANKSKTWTSQKKKGMRQRKNRKSTKQLHSRKLITKKHQKKSKKNPIDHRNPTLKPQLKVNTENIAKSSLPNYLLSTIEKKLVNFVRNTVATIRYSTYKLGGSRIDTLHGIYIVDCSTYVDHILKSVFPSAFTSLTSFSGTEKPTTNDFYHYFTNLSDGHYWHSIDDVEELRPGDILVFRYKNKFNNEVGGHVVVIMDKPIQDGDTLLLRIADSAPSRHSTDTRLPHESGIGIGTMLLKVDLHTYRPYAYAWRIGSRWETNASFAMARPILA